MGLKVINMIDDWFGAASASEVNNVHATVREILISLGWILNDKGTPPALSTLFLGLIVNTLTMEFHVPKDKVERCIALINTLRGCAAEHRPVRVKDLQRLTGLTTSNILAIPSLRVWTRALYREVALATDRYAAWVVMDTDSTDELAEIAHLLLTRNGAPICLAAHPTDVLFVDAGESGFGGHYLEKEWAGHLPADLIGTSSTRRELYGADRVLEMAETEGFKFPERLLVCFDSSCSVRNLEKGGGPKQDLNLVVKQIAVRCARMGITLVPVWIPREQNTRADALSKKLSATWTMPPNRVAALEATAGFPVRFPHYNTIRTLVKISIAQATRAAFIVPKWTAQSWWSHLAEHFTLISVDRNLFTPVPGVGLPAWDMVLAFK